MSDLRTTFSATKILGNVDLDAPIYRITPLWFLEETIRLANTVLVPPDRWEDPFEWLPQSVMMTDQSTTPWKQTPLEQFLRPAYAQCWSRTEDSDTLLRAYSRVVLDRSCGRNICPSDEGVRVRSSPRKLLRMVETWSKSTPGFSCFLGPVRYESQDDVMQNLANELGRNRPDAVGKGRLRANQLLSKRSAFSHEAEIRLIVVQEQGNPPDLLRIPFDRLDLFDEITFDPRLKPFERQEREKAVEALGYPGRFGQSLLYQRILLEIPFPQGLPTAP